MDGLSFPRYSPAPFPRYRFVPGQFPHPTAHPQGHSYRPPEAPDEGVELPKPEDWADCAVYLTATDLYNHGYWWEAHETWESLWQKSEKSGVQGRFLQGLIQVAACHLKWHVGHLDGVARLRLSSNAHLAVACTGDVGGGYMGVVVREFRERVSRYYGEISARFPGGGPHDPATYPYLVLRA